MSCGQIKLEWMWTRAGCERPPFTFPASTVVFLCSNEVGTTQNPKKNQKPGKERAEIDSTEYARGRQDASSGWSETERPALVREKEDATSTKHLKKHSMQIPACRVTEKSPIDTRPTRRVKASSSISRFSAKPILNLIKKMKRLSAQLPDTIPEASEADDIVRVITTVHGIDESLRLTTTKICASPQRRKRFKSIAAALYKDEKEKSGRKTASLMVIRDVKHRWNFTEAMITRALKLRKAIHRWVIERDELLPLRLEEKDWTFLESLGQILQVFTKVMLEMSKSTTPTLPFVIPMYEKMLKHLHATREDENVLQPLCVAVSAGLEKLNTYYEKARACQFNVI
ncbi:hypothetical protein B0H14DRAFT_3162898, partial [Mycena olivaceomarginata]